jgi:hypothetical protein
MADVDINKFRASVVRDGSKPSSPGFVVSEGQDPVDPSGSGQNHLPVTIAAAATGLAITDSQVLGGAGTTSQYLRGDASLATFPALTGYVPYTGANQTVNLNTQQLQAGHTTLTTNGSTETLTINHTSGSGKAINVTKGGNGEGLYINKTSGSGNAATIVGKLEATTLVKTGGTSSQFLKADGSVDSTTYQNTADKGQPNGYASLDGNGKVPLTQINDALIGNVNFQGLWNAATNTPTLVDPPSSGTKGYYYIVSTGGTFAGITFEVGDWIISNGTAWGKVDNTDAVSSVFGRTGNVVASNGDYNTSQVTESGNLYYTDARSRAALSFAAGSGAYNSGTGVITIPTNNNQITNGAGYITSAALSAYLPLTGGTLTGALNGTSGAFSGGLTVTSASSTGMVVNSTNGASFRGFTIQANGTTQGGIEILPNTGEIRIGGYSTTSDYYPVIYSDGVAALTFGIGASPSATFSGALNGTSASFSSGLSITSGAISLIPSSFAVGSASATDGNSLTIQSANSNYLLRFKNAAGTSIGGFYYDGTNFVADGPGYKFINAATFSSSVTATSFIRIGGTSAQFLKADGSVDSNAYTTNTGTVTSVSGTGTVSGLSLSGTVTTSGNLTLGGTLSLTSANVTDALGFTPYNATNPAGYTTNVGTVTSVAASAGTGISISGSPITSSGTLTITNTAPDQIVSLSASTGISISGTYPNFTITNTSPSSGGTVTSVTASSPLASSGGTTPNITIQQASGSQSGFISSTDWTTFNSKQNALTNPVTGTGTTNYLPKFTGASTIGNSNIQDSGSLVSVGVTSTFASNINVTNNVLINLGTASTASTGGTLWLTTNNNTSRAAAIQAITQTTDNAHDLLFYTNSTFDTPKERLRIFSDGNVFIGPTASNNGARLQVSGNATIGSGAGLSQLTVGSGAGYTGIVLSNNSGFYSWLLGSQYNVSNAFEITPSTALGGSTFTTPVFKITNTGAATFSGSVTAVNGIYTGTGEVIANTAAGTVSKYIRLSNNSGHFYGGVEGATPDIITGATAYDASIRGYSGISFSANGGSNLQMRITSGGNVLIGTSVFDNGNKLKVDGQVFINANTQLDSKTTTGVGSSPVPVANFSNSEGSTYYITALSGANYYRAILLGVQNSITVVESITVGTVPSKSFVILDNIFNMSIISGSWTVKCTQIRTV